MVSAHHPLKSALVAHCRSYASGRVAELREEIRRLQSSANEETKSTAGDKHETARAMAQLEVEMLLKRLEDALRLEQNALALSDRPTGERVVNGSLVVTNSGTFFIAISVGAVTVENRPFFVVSPESPIGRSLTGKASGDTVQWNGKHYSLLKVE